MNHTKLWAKLGKIEIKHGGILDLEIKACV
jgi:hypothetical protein